MVMSVTLLLFTQPVYEYKPVSLAIFYEMQGLPPIMLPWVENYTTIETCEKDAPRVLNYMMDSTAKDSIAIVQAACYIPDAIDT